MAAFVLQGVPIPAAVTGAVAEPSALRQQQAPQWETNLKAD